MVFSFPHSGSTLPCLPEAAGFGAPLCSCCWAGGTAPGWCWAACCPWQLPAPRAGLLLAMAAAGRPAGRANGRAAPHRARAAGPGAASADCRQDGGLCGSDGGAFRGRTGPRARRRGAGAASPPACRGRPRRPSRSPAAPHGPLPPGPALSATRGSPQRRGCPSRARQAGRPLPGKARGPCGRRGTVTAAWRAVARALVLRLLLLAPRRQSSGDAAAAPLERGSGAWRGPSPCAGGSTGGTRGK